MATAARIEASLGLNDAEFLAGIARAEKRAQQFSQRTSKFVGDTFRKHGSAQVTLANFGENVLRGDLPNAIRGLSMGMAGIGLAAGVGVAVASDAFLRLYDHIKETAKARSDLGDLMSRPMQLIVDSGQAAAHIERLKGAAAVVQEKTYSLSQQALDALQFTYGSGDEKKETSQRQREINEALAAADEGARMSGRRELIRANVLAGISDPKRRALAEQRLKFDDREAVLKANPDKGSRARLEALKVESAEFEKKYNLQKQGDKEAEASAARQFETAKKLIALGQSGLGADEQKRLAAQMRLRDVGEDLKGGNLSTDQRRKLGLDALQQEAILRTGKPAARARFGSFERRWDDQDFQSGARFANNPFGSIDDRWSQQDSAPADDLSGDILNELQQLRADQAKYWGG